MPDKQTTNDKHLRNYEIVMQMMTPSEDTRYNYYSYAKKFLTEFNGTPERATTFQITEYIINNCKSRSSMAQCRSALKVLFERVFKQPNKVAFIPYPKQEERIKDTPTHSQMMQIIDLTVNVKHKLIITILYGTGMRLNELLQIKWKDIKREDGINPLSVKVHGKGAKDRKLPLSEKIAELLKQYCKDFGLKCDTNKEHYIFGNNYGAPYSSKSVANVVEEAGKRIGIKLTPHLIRHACFTSLSYGGMELLQIQDLAGHNSFKTTKIYAKSNNVNRTMPI